MNNQPFLKILLPFVDVLLACLMIFITMTILIKADSKKQDAAYQQSAAYLIVLTWEGDADLDLWVQDPQGHKVGFKRREGGEGSMLSLNRDCLGARRTEVNQDGEVINPVNEEIVSIRGIAPGEFIVNVHAYNLNSSKTPLAAKVKLMKIKPFQDAKETSMNFEQTGDELTFFRFTLDKKGTVSDINTLPTSILKGSSADEGAEPTDAPTGPEPQP